MFVKVVKGPYRSFSRDVIGFYNPKLKSHQILSRYKRQYIYICLQFYSSIGCFVWKPEHFEVQGYGGAWHKSTIEFVVACVASVPERYERNWGRAKEVFAFGPREKWGDSKRWKERGASFFVQPEREKTSSRGPNFVRVVRERLLRRLSLLKNIHLSHLMIWSLFRSYCIRIVLQWLFVQHW